MHGQNTSIATAAQALRDDVCRSLRTRVDTASHQAQEKGEGAAGQGGNDKGGDAKGGKGGVNGRDGGMFGGVVNGCVVVDVGQRVVVTTQHKVCCCLYGVRGIVFIGGTLMKSVHILMYTSTPHIHPHTRYIYRHYQLCVIT